MDTYNCKGWRYTHFFCCFIVFFFLSGCLSRGDNPIDPYEKYNRKIYALNQSLDKAIATPLAKTYVAITPKPLRRGIHNVYTNIWGVSIVINDILQGKFDHAIKDSFRLAINSTIGVLGFFDLATPMGLDYHYQDFGLTLAAWGFEKSTYQEIPFFGPRTWRDAIGDTLDYYLSPFPYIKSNKLRYGLYAGYLVDKRASYLDEQKLLTEIALDPYAFQRDAYLQYRQMLINRNKGINTDTSLAENTITSDDLFIEDEDEDDNLKEEKATNEGSKQTH